VLSKTSPIPRTLASQIRIYLVLVFAFLFNITSGVALANNEATSNSGITAKLQESYDALAKKETPEEADWKNLYEVCAGMFELRDFSRIFDCGSVAEKWKAKVGEEPIHSLTFAEMATASSFSKIYNQHAGFPTLAGVRLLEARAQLEAGNHSKAIELAKLALAEDKRVYQASFKECQSVSLKTCHLHGSHFNFILEENLLLATALFLEGKRDESKLFQKNVDDLINSFHSLDKKQNAKMLGVKVQLYLATERYLDAYKLIEKDSYAVENLASAGAMGYRLLGLLNLNLLSALDTVSALSHAVDITSDAHTCATKFQLAHLRYKAGKAEEAKKQFDELLNEPLIKTFGSIYWAALFDRGSIAESEGKIDDAVRYYTSAIDEIELQRSTINAEGARIGFFGDKQEVYQALVRLLVKTGKTEEAFLITERSKARALVDMFANKQNFHVASADDVKVREFLTQQQHSDNLTVFNGEIPAEIKDQPKAASDKEQAKQNLNATAEHIRNLKVESSKGASALPPELASLVSVTPINLADIRQNLPADETIISYYYDKTNLYAFLLDKQNVKSIKLAREGLEKDVEAYRQALQDNAGDYANKAQALYSRLITPLTPEIKTTKLVIAPHGALHYLPFAALSDGNGYLVDQYQLTFLPSASTIKFIGKAPSDGKAGNILVLGNPDLGDASYSLAFAEKEAKSIGAIFPGSMVLLGSKASKSNLKEYGSGFKYLHFAMHGKFDSDKPLESALMLATKSIDNINDQLTVSELYSMNLDADLVTLSACETGLGKVSNGDDVVGLVRGFLYAGANNVISTLWSIDDQATEALMVTFYKDIQSGKSKANALRNAQISLRKTYPNPRYWAAFQMTGVAEENSSSAVDMQSDQNNASPANKKSGVKKKG
jgi:CHAT domain-containing protein